jgi:UDP-glucose 4-epimerase
VKRRVLVTGGAGFIGSHVADVFLGAGWDVTVLDNLSRGRRQNVPPGAEFLLLDVGSVEARELIAARRFEVISHHAAQVDVRISVADPVLDAEENILAFINLLEGARLGGTRRVIAISSGGVVYGERVPPHRETAPKLPLSPYGCSKLAGEHYLACYAQLHGVAGVALRYSNVYGPRQDPHGEAGVVAIFGSRLRAGQPLTIYGDGEQTRDYVYVTDVARANLLAAEADLPAPDGTIDARAFNIGTGVLTSVNALANTMIEAAGVRVAVERAPARTGELLASSLVAEKAGRVLGWTPRVGLAEGLRATYDWIVKEAS